MAPAQGLEIETLRVHSRLRSISRRAVRLERLHPNDGGTETRMMLARQVLLLINEFVDTLRTPRGPDDLTATVFLRRGHLTPATCTLVASAIPPELRRFIDKCSGFLLSDRELVTADPSGLTLPFRNKVYLIPRSSETHLLAPFEHSSPEALVMRTELATLIDNSGERGAFWKRRGPIGPLASQFNAQLEGTSPRGLAFTRIMCPGSGETYGVTVTVRTEPFEDVVWPPAFRRSALYGLTDLGWTLGYYMNSPR